ncbi:YgaP family membrane protein [Methanocella sp. MCL-LM]|uniref:YgaP family membrane protein n=1 Tax=Methanocella sp. MCL-LM TaxID=3412035 RepID=UPI003C757F40
MEQNVGEVDRIIRFLIGLFLVGTGLFLLFEAATGWCATYELLGINTRETPYLK